MINVSALFVSICYRCGTKTHSVYAHISSMWENKNLRVLFSQGRVLSCGMDDVQEQDQYEEQLKEVFNSFDTSGCGSLCPEELSELCQSLHLDEATPVLIQTLLQNQDHLTARVSFLLSIDFKKY